MMRFTETTIPGLYLIDLESHTDERGSFVRQFCRKKLAAQGIAHEFVQCNLSVNPLPGTLRGIHFQAPPASEAKLVRCIRGRIFDVVVDIRQGSPTFLQWIGIELAAENPQSLYIPEGCAHGFQTMQDNCEILYHHTQFYDPAHSFGIRYDDPALAISWPLSVTQISNKDSSYCDLTAEFKGICP